MKKEKITYWSNVSKKPKGFTFVKGEPMTYTYEIPVLGFNKHTFGEIDKIFIKIKMKYDKDIERVEIDFLATKNLIAKEVGNYKFDYTDHGLFQRDRTLFPFIDEIKIFDGEEDKYFHYRLMKNRRAKLNRIMKKSTK